MFPGGIAIFHRIGDFGFILQEGATPADQDAARPGDRITESVGPNWEAPWRRSITTHASTPSTPQAG